MTSQKLHTYAGDAIDLAEPDRDASRPAAEKPAEPRWTHIHAPDVRASAAPAVAWRGLRRELKVFISNPNALFGVAFLVAAALAALLAPVLYPGDPMEMVARPFLWPGQNAAYPLGTD